jgi:excisionase family DNA binding protein
METNIQEHHHQWLAPKEVAAELRVDVASVYRAIRTGHMPAMRLSDNGALRVHRSVLDEHKEKPA